jgi:hypothetical protein
LFGWNVRLLTGDSRYGSLHFPATTGKEGAFARG